MASACRWQRPCLFGTPAVCLSRAAHLTRRYARPTMPQRLCIFASYFYYLAPQWYALFVGEGVTCSGGEVATSIGHAPLSVYVTR